MRRRLFRRVPAASAILAGMTGMAADACLILYFALARPWQPGHHGPWEWLGPANDIIGSLSMAALIPVIVHARRRLPDDRLLGVLSVGGALAAAGSAAAGPLLVAGAITLDAQFVVAGLGLPLFFCWLWRMSRTAGRTSLLPARTAWFGERIGMIALGATALGGVGSLLPAGSPAQYVVIGLAALPGLPAYLVFPVWLILAGRSWLGGPGGAPSLICGSVLDPGEIGRYGAGFAREADGPAGVR